MRKFYKIRHLFLLMFISMSQWNLSIAQKLPKVQTSSIRAPQSLKIDGKTTEWNDEFQAYNWGNLIYYTLSNDDNNLYLTARLDDLGFRKIIRGGLTFTVNSQLKKGEKLSITFPVMKPTMETDELWKLKDAPIVYKTLKLDTISNKIRIDSLIYASNNLIRKGYDQMRVLGIPEANVPIISIYNMEGIKVGASVDNRMRYIYELAIPLKYLEPAIINGKSFKYNIQLNGSTGSVIINSVPTTRPMVTAFRFTGPGSIDGQFLYDATGFSGEYTLAVKQ